MKSQDHCMIWIADEDAELLVSPLKFSKPNKRDVASYARENCHKLNRRWCNNLQTDHPWILCVLHELWKSSGPKVVWSWCWDCYIQQCGFFISQWNSQVLKWSCWSVLTSHLPSVLQCSFLFLRARDVQLILQPGPHGAHFHLKWVGSVNLLCVAVKRRLTTHCNFRIMCFSTC